jgi:hypothetical protein
MLCDTIAATEKWALKPVKEKDLRYNVGAFHPTESFPLAVTSLQSLAILGGVQYCEKEGRKFADMVHEYWKDEKGAVRRATGLHRAGGFAADGLPYNSNAIYAETFLAHLYRTLLATEKDDTRRKRYQEELEKAEAQLKKTLGRVAEGGEKHPFPSSVFQSHAFNASLLGAKDLPDDAEAIAKKVEKTVEKNPATMPYYPTEPTPGTERGSAPRSAAFWLARLKGWIQGDVKGDPRAKLMKTLERYGRYAPAYAAHATREGTHGLLGQDTPNDAIAPYYFWANIAYVSSAIRYLEQNGDLSEDDKKTLAWVKRRHLEAIATLRDEKEKTFKSPGPGTYPGGKTWGNAFAILSLLPLIDKCDGKAVVATTGPWLPKEVKPAAKAEAKGPAHARGADAKAPTVAKRAHDGRQGKEKN